MGFGETGFGGIRVMSQLFAPVQLLKAISVALEAMLLSRPIDAVTHNMSLRMCSSSLLIVGAIDSKKRGLLPTDKQESYRLIKSMSYISGYPNM